MKAKQSEYVQGVGEDGTLLTFTPQPSPFHKPFYNMATNSENWGIEETPERVEACCPNPVLGKIVHGHKFTYYQVYE
jgi:hypothetical protein